MGMEGRASPTTLFLALLVVLTTLVPLAWLAWDGWWDLWHKLASERIMRRHRRSMPEIHARAEAAREWARRVKR